MKLAFNIVGGLVFLTGAVWFFQGIGVIQGSIMTNTTTWTVIGAVLVVIGSAALVYINRRKTPVDTAS